MKNNFLDFSTLENSNSKFTAILESRGGNITFSNSGKGGNKKHFNLSLDTFLNCLKDIRYNLNQFQGHELYVEKEWRDLGSTLYTDKPGNAQSTVQTKPMFVTLSKIIIWANPIDLLKSDPEQEISLKKEHLDKAISKLDFLAENYKPEKNKINNNIELNEVIVSKSIRDFAFMVFKYFYEDSWDKILEKSKVKDSTINDLEYKVYHHESFNNLIGAFPKPQNKETLSSSNTQRYFEDSILHYNNFYYYFTNQWNATGEYNLSFDNLKKFIESNQNNYEVVKNGKVFQLLSQKKLKSLKISSFKKDSEASGLKYSTKLITRYISSLVTKPFVLLSGLSGSGKTKLAQSFAQWICEDERQYCIVPVGADWTNREPLLGYVNALDPKEYVLPENGALELIINANKPENGNKPYFLILDEMNLSHVERYFADFLSVMESNDPFKLHSSEVNLNVETEGDKGVMKFSDVIEVPNKIRWPKNLFVVGTVNIDETTYMFSPKVLDRANVIEFRVDKDDMIDYLANPKKVSDLNGEGKSMDKSFVGIATAKSTSSTKELTDTLESFFSELQKVGAEFGYRTASEIKTLFGQIDIVNPDFLNKEQEKIDIAIMQKLLPKLHGSRRKLTPVLETLGNLCISSDDVKTRFFESKELIKYKEDKTILFPLSLEKIVRMNKSLLDNGFASYAEA